MHVVKDLVAEEGDKDGHKDRYSNLFAFDLHDGGVAPCDELKHSKTREELLHFS